MKSNIKRVLINALEIEAHQLDNNLELALIEDYEYDYIQELRNELKELETAIMTIKEL